MTPPPQRDDLGPGVEVEVRVLPHGLGLPTRAHPGDAGLDLCTTDDAELEPGQRVLVGTGIALALPDDHVGLVHPRSGLAARTGLTVLNAPGTIDAGYRGEVAVCLVNHDPEHAVHLRRGDRVAQLVIQRVARVVLREVAQLPGSERGTQGHGSSGGSAHLAVSDEQTGREGER